MGKPKALVITVGKGRNVEHGMVKSIENQNPDLVLFLATQESWDAKKPLLFELLPNLQLINDFKEFKSGADSIFAVVKIVNETFDLEKLILAYSDVIRELLKYFPPQNVTADYTPGTKAMSAALAIVAIEMGLKSLSYIAGDRDIDGRVISGSEREITLTPSKYLCLRNILESVKLFNKKLPRAALTTVDFCRFSEAHKNLNRLRNFLHDIYTAYNQWDLFQQDKAFDIFTNALRNNDDIAAALGLKRILSDTMRILARIKDSSKRCIEKPEVPCDPLISLDIYFNAQRRGILGRWDDAAARLYRTLEFIAQMKLKEKGIITSNVDLNKLKNSELKERLPKTDNKVTTGLYNDYYILYKEFNDPLGEKFINDFHDKNSKVRKFLDVRNYSILAHGLHPVPEETVKEFSELLLNEYIFNVVDKSEYDRFKRVFLFPEINQQKVYEVFLKHA